MPLVTCVGFSQDGKHLASLARDDTLRIWDASTRMRIAELQLPTNDWRLAARAAFQTQGSHLASGGSDGGVRLWDFSVSRWAQERGESRPVYILQGHQGPVDDVAFSPDGAQLASAGLDTTVRLWDVRQRASTAVLRGHSERVNRLAFSTDGRWLASASHDKTVCLWNAKTYDLVTTLAHGSYVYGLAFHPSGTRLAAGCADGTIRLWDTSTWAQVAELRGHKDYVHAVAVAFSPDGSRLASASGDFTVRIWDNVPAQERRQAVPAQP